MEMEQISQSLRTLMVQQSQQGMTASQMMSSGISFADIISMMISNTNTGSVNEAESGLFDLPLFQTGKQPDADSIIPEQFSDIFSLVSPEIMKSSKAQSSWFTELFSDDAFTDTAETIDFSDSIIKADPSQLAGLLNFIRTGTEIPLFTQADSPADKSGVIQDIKSVFDPKEMIKSGEMEIISYTPAKQTGTQDNTEMSDSSRDEVLDFYRTMNTVKNEVKSDVRNEVKNKVSNEVKNEVRSEVKNEVRNELKTEVKYGAENEVKKSDVSAELKAAEDNNTGNDIKDKEVYTLESLSRYAEPVDISFERAEAELTMNKAEYELPEKQLLKGVSENLEQGKSEFTVKLKPEGLGEILVKLVSDNDGKMLLTMVASSEKTAELLNRDLASLQSSLSQHNVEIANNSIDTARNVMPAASAFDQYDERRQDEGSQQNQFRQLKSKIKNISVGNVSFDSETDLQMNSAPDQALNIII